MSPLGFDAQQMFRFLSVRFEATNLRIQQQTLNWLQLLSSLHISVNISLLVNIFEEGVTTGKLDDLGDLPGYKFFISSHFKLFQFISSHFKSFQIISIHFKLFQFS